MIASESPSISPSKATDEPTYPVIIVVPPRPPVPTDEDCIDIDETDCILFAIMNCLSFTDPKNSLETQTCFYRDMSGDGGGVRQLLEDELAYHWNAIDHLTKL